MIIDVRVPLMSCLFLKYCQRLIALLLCIMLLQWTSAQETQTVFKHLTVEDGLSNNWVRTILKDSDGFMWFGTFNGLNTYDGNHFTVYQSNDSSHLSDNVIECLSEDVLGNIWVGTFSGGLNRFDKKTARFATFLHDPSNTQSISGNRVYALFADTDTTLWIGTDAGLDLFHIGKGTFTHFNHDPEDPLSITAGLVSCIYPDHNGRLWIGTQNGVSIFHRDKHEFHRVIQQDKTSASQNYIKSIYEDKYGNIWLGSWGGGIDQYVVSAQKTYSYKQSFGLQNGLSNNSVLSVSGDNENLIYIATEGGGLNVLDIQQQTINAFVPDITDVRSINSNSVHTLFYDNENGLLWAGTYNGGVNYFSKWDKPFVLYKARLQGLNNPHVTSIAQDRQGRVFIGTDGGGVNILDERTVQFAYITEQQGLLSNAVLSLLCDNEQNIWIGSYHGGLDLLQSGDGRLKHFKHDPADLTSLSGTHVSTIYEDRRGQLWVGTMSEGLNLYHRASGGFEHFRNDPTDPNTIIDNFIYGIYEDRLGRMLVQTGGGLEVFDYKNGTFSRFGPTASIDVGVPIALCEDSHGNLWIGSQENGLFRVDRTGVEVKAFTMKDGLPGNSISGILEDEFGNLWISTQRGLCKFEEGVLNPNRVRFHVYSVEDGLQGSEFKRGASFKTADGRLLFGGQNGFNVFDPVKIKQNPFVPPVAITGFKIFNKDVEVSAESVLNVPITEADEITLDHTMSVFTFEFSALSYLLSEKNQYAYMMEGFEENWNHVGTQRSATYSNLDPGTYTFLVKASNNDGVWNETPTQLKVTIIPPWWATMWFKICLALVLLGLVVGYLRLRMYQLRRAKDELAYKVELGTADLKKASAVIEERQTEILSQNAELVLKNHELEEQTNEIRRMAEEIKELTEAKITFFANVSHELHTPLNAIVHQAEELLSWHHRDVDPLADKHMSIYQNATRLIRMINQLLDMNKAVTGALAFNPEFKDIGVAIRSAFDEHLEWADKKHVNYTLDSSVKELQMWFDTEKFNKAFSHLISNAFKSVPEDGVIAIRVNVNAIEKPPRLQIEVHDSGKGVPPDQVTQLTQMFNQKSKSSFPGSGIGLSLVKELMDLHQGAIRVESKPGHGASFFLEIPVHDEMHVSGNAAEGHADVTRFIEELDDIKDTVMQKPSILIIDNEGEGGQHKWQRLKTDYQVALIQTGSDGFDHALGQLPDLIICDMHLSDVDGLELCRRLKENEQTSHIPIIVMASRTNDDMEVSQSSQYADDHIATPFHADLLELKIKNIFFTRDKLKEMFLRGSMSQSESGRNAVDEQFVRKALAVVRENLRNSEFGVNEFSVYFGMSRRNVLRKMKAVTGLSINEYIRNTRLKEAYSLLQNGELNVSEVAYTVGFTDPKYFSNCFKKLFGKPPSEVRSVANV